VQSSVEQVVEHSASPPHEPESPPGAARAEPTAIMLRKILENIVIDVIKLYWEVATEV